MGRVLKIVFYALVLALLFLWIMTLAKSCGKAETDTTVDTETSLDEFSDDLDEDMTDLSSDEFEDDEFEDEIPADDLTSSGDDAEEISYEDLDEAIESVDDLTEPIKEESSSQSSNTAQETYTAPKKYASTGNGFLLVAGSYSIHSNAEQMRSKLKRMGYEDAEIVQFENSSFSTVVAQRFENYESALNEASNLKSRGIDCYVHKKK